MKWKRLYETKWLCVAILSYLIMLSHQQDLRQHHQHQQPQQQHHQHQQPQQQHRQEHRQSNDGVRYDEKFDKQEKPLSIRQEDQDENRHRHEQSQQRYNELKVMKTTPSIYQPREQDGDSAPQSSSPSSSHKHQPSPHHIKGPQRGKRQRPPRRYRYRHRRHKLQQNKLKQKEKPLPPIRNENQHQTNTLPTPSTLNHLEPPQHHSYTTKHKQKHPYRKLKQEKRLSKRVQEEGKLLHLPTEKSSSSIDSHHQSHDNGQDEPVPSEKATFFDNGNDQHSLSSMFESFLSSITLPSLPPLLSQLLSTSTPSSTDKTDSFLSSSSSSSSLLSTSPSSSSSKSTTSTSIELKIAHNKTADKQMSKNKQNAFPKSTGLNGNEIIEKDAVQSDFPTEMISKRKSIVPNNEIRDVQSDGRDRSLKRERRRKLKEMRRNRRARGKRRRRHKNNQVEKIDTGVKSTQAPKTVFDNELDRMKKVVDSVDTTTGDIIGDSFTGNENSNVIDVRINGEDNDNDDESGDDGDDDEGDNDNVGAGISTTPGSALANGKGEDFEEEEEEEEEEHKDNEASGTAGLDNLEEDNDDDDETGDETRGVMTGLAQGTGIFSTVRELVLTVKELYKHQDTSRKKIKALERRHQNQVTDLHLAQTKIQNFENKFADVDAVLDQLDLTTSGIRQEMANLRNRQQKSEKASRKLRFDFGRLSSQLEQVTERFDQSQDAQNVEGDTIEDVKKDLESEVGKIWVHLESVGNKVERLENLDYKRSRRTNKISQDVEFLERSFEELKENSTNLIYEIKELRSDVDDVTEAVTVSMDPELRSEEWDDDDVENYDAEETTAAQKKELRRQNIMDKDKNVKRDKKGMTKESRNNTAVVSHDSGSVDDEKSMEEEEIPPSGIDDETKVRKTRHLGKTNANSETEEMPHTTETYNDGKNSVSGVKRENKGISEEHTSDDDEDVDNSNDDTTTMIAPTPSLSPTTQSLSSSSNNHQSANQGEDNPPSDTKKHHNGTTNQPPTISSSTTELVQTNPATKSMEESISSSRTLKPTPLLNNAQMSMTSLSSSPHSFVPSSYESSSIDSTPSYPSFISSSHPSIPTKIANKNKDSITENMKTGNEKPANDNKINSQAKSAEFLTNTSSLGYKNLDFTNTKNISTNENLMPDDNDNYLNQTLETNNNNKNSSNSSIYVGNYIFQLEERIHYLETVLAKALSSSSKQFENINIYVEKQTDILSARIGKQEEELKNKTNSLKEELQMQESKSRNDSSEFERMLGSNRVQMTQLEGKVSRTGVILSQLVSQVSSINMSEFLARLKESLTNFTKNVVTVDQWRVARQTLVNATITNEARISSLAQTSMETTQQTTELQDRLTTVHSSSRRWYRSLQGHVIRLNNTLQDFRERIDQVSGQVVRSSQPAKPSQELQSKMDNLHIQLLINSNRLSTMEAKMLNKSLEFCRRSSTSLRQASQIVHLEQKQTSLREEFLLQQEQTKRVDVTVLRLLNTLKVNQDDIAHVSSEISELKPVKSKITRLEKELDKLLLQVPKDCQGYYERGFRDSGVYVIFPLHMDHSVRVYCVMEHHRLHDDNSLDKHNSHTRDETSQPTTTDKTSFNYDDEEDEIDVLDDVYEELGIGSVNDGGDDVIMNAANKARIYNGGWTVIQRRFDGSVNFSRPWLDYAAGFGRVRGEYWLGNDIIHFITSQNEYEIRIVMEDMFSGMWEARYDLFKIENREASYRLQVSGYQGNASDGLGTSNQMAFSAFDRDEDASSSHCALYGGGGWWYRHCHISNLNGPFNVGVVWFNRAWQDWVQMKSSVMMLRPKNKMSKKGRRKLKRRNG